VAGRAFKFVNYCMKNSYSATLILKNCTHLSWLMRFELLGIQCDNNWKIHFYRHPCNLFVLVSILQILILTNETKEWQSQLNNSCIEEVNVCSWQTDMHINTYIYIKMCFKLSQRRPELFTSSVPSCIFNDEQMRCLEFRPKKLKTDCIAKTLRDGN